MTDEMPRALAPVASGGEVLIPVDSDHPAHTDMFKTLDLLMLRIEDLGPLYFIVEGCAKFEDRETMDSAHRYFYEERSCPTNFIPVIAIFTHQSDDPHDVFEHVESQWMTQAYLDAVAEDREDAYLRELFPITRGPSEGETE